MHPLSPKEMVLSVKPEDLDAYFEFLMALGKGLSGMLAEPLPEAAQPSKYYERERDSCFSCWAIPSLSGTPHRVFCVSIASMGR